MRACLVGLCLRPMPSFVQLTNGSGPLLSDSRACVSGPDGPRATSKSFRRDSFSDPDRERENRYQNEARGEVLVTVEITRR